MEKTKFKNLLTDLYNIYNPANLQYIDDLVERYARLEFDALKNVFIKYNNKAFPYYDSEVGTDQYILNLIKEYESGLRSLKDVNIKEQIKDNAENLVKKAKEEDLNKTAGLEKKIEEKVTIEIKDKVENIEKSFSEKEKKFEETLSEIYKEFEAKLSKSKQENEDITVRIFSIQSNSEIDLPNKKVIAGLGKGARLLIKNDAEKVIGLEIIDISYDTISQLDGKPLIEIFVGEITN